jgi:hypothetical protein
LNVGVGVVEFVPDHLPLVGNLDEATATFLLLNCLAYLGIIIGPLPKRRPTDRRRKSESPESAAEKKV